MSQGNKLIKKIGRKSKAVHKNLDSDFKRRDKADQRPTVASASPGVYKVMRGMQRRFDKAFGIDNVVAKPLIAVRINCTTFERYDFGVGDYGIRMTIPADIVSFVGFRPKDVIQVLEGTLAGSYLEVVSVIDSTHIRVEDVSSYIGNPGVAEVTQVVTVADSSGSLDGTYFLINSAADATEYYVWYDVDAGGNDPAVVGKTGIPVSIATDDDADTVAAATQVAVEANADFSATVDDDTIIITNAASGDTTDAADNDTGFTISTEVQGEDYDATASESNIVVRFEASTTKKSFS